MSAIDHLTDDQARLIYGAIEKLQLAAENGGLRVHEILTLEERHAVAHLLLSLPKEDNHATDGPQQHPEARPATGT